MLIVSLIGIVSCLVVSSILFLWSGNSRLVAGVYKQPGQWYWLKRAVFYILYHLRSMKDRKRKSTSSYQEKHSLTENYTRGYGKGQMYTQMEKPQVLAHENSIDTSYFAATGKDGSKIVCRLARRKHRRAEIWLFVDVPGIGPLQHPRHPDTDVYYTDAKSFTAGSLRFEVVEPMKKWKLSYSGKLRKGLCNTITDKPSDFVETSFSFTWCALTQPFNFDTDMACSVLGDGVAREDWNKDFLNRLKSQHQTHYEQWGELRGGLNVEGHQHRQLFLPCVRDHTIGLRDWRSFHRYIIHFIYLETGMCIQVGVVSQPCLMSHIAVGYVAYPNGDVVPVTGVQLNLWQVGEASRSPPSNYSFTFQTGRQRYQVQVATDSQVPEWFHHQDRGGKVLEAFSTFTVNSLPARGIAEFFYRNHDGPNFVPPVAYPMVSELPSSMLKEHRQKMTLAFTQEACQSPALVGGKAAQLAQLTSLHGKVNASVPPGFCLTLESFQLQLEQNPAMNTAIQVLAQTAVQDATSLPSACQQCAELIAVTEVCDCVRRAVLDSLHTLKGPAFANFHFAVRSSAAGEDGDEASSAGQMETLLGVVGVDQILKSIQKCWASVYTHQAVEYRRQHGQPIRVLAGVVIQEMVPADAAGVLFTADPMTGSSSHLVINANFGLGESVVSGKSDPDTIFILRDPNVRVIDESNCRESLKIGSITRGKKQTKITETGHGGVKEELVDNGGSVACLSDDLIFRLATLGIELEKYFGSSKDIEWAVVKEHIFLLQCRPIIVTDTDTEEDIMHEFDSPVTCDYQWLTTSNISEMMPGVVTPLTLSTFRVAIELGLQTFNLHLGARRVADRLPKCLPAFSNHLFIALLDISTIFMSTLLVRKDTMEISLLGSLLPELSVDHIQDYYGHPKESWPTRLCNFIGMMRMYSKAKRLTHEWETKVPSYSVGQHAQTATQLYECIDSQLCDYETVWVWTLINSGKSGSWATILMSVLGGHASEWTNEQHGDIALLLSQCEGVYSAEVPHALESIARAISEACPPITDSFLASSDLECVEMMKQYPDLQSKVDTFLQRHGHRCLKESELREKSWRSAPEKFISVLKSMLKTKSYYKKERPIIEMSQLLNQMKTKPSKYKRFVLKMLLPKAWAAVGARERGKSVAVQISEVFKLAYSRLSELMHVEGRLPDADLLYFLTHQEIGLLLKSQSSKLITRSTAYKVCMPVSQGQTIGPARVVHTLEQASIIEAGDILVVNSTDVGWSPYFPLIGGLVTELGGLISHGAVVAREYGIPCVVNVANATTLIQSGEKVKIDGRLGVVERLSA